MQFSFVDGCQHFYLEDGGNTFLQHVGNHLQDYTALEPRRCSTFSLLGENLKFQDRLYPDTFYTVIMYILSQEFTIESLGCII
jgi:hypothetical protein